jgi:hypothetical protein
MTSISPDPAWQFHPSAAGPGDALPHSKDKLSPASHRTSYQRGPGNLDCILFGLPEVFDAAKDESVYSPDAPKLRPQNGHGCVIHENAPARFDHLQPSTAPGHASVHLRKSTDFFPKPLSGLAFYALD